MKILIWRFYLVTTFIGLACFGPASTTFAQEKRDLPADRLERLERRVNELAERQKQMISNRGEQMERQERRERPGPMFRQEKRNFRAPMERHDGDGLRPTMPVPPGRPEMAFHHAEAKHKDGVHELVKLFIFIGILCNILLAIWIYTDIRKRGEGSGIFVALALVAGIPAALIYALTRLGEKKT
jgi:hypothetical protein